MFLYDELAHHVPSSSRNLAGLPNELKHTLNIVYSPPHALEDTNSHWQPVSLLTNHSNGGLQYVAVYCTGRKQLCKAGGESQYKRKSCRARLQGDS